MKDDKKKKKCGASQAVKYSPISKTTRKTTNHNKVIEEDSIESEEDAKKTKRKAKRAPRSTTKPTRKRESDSSDSADDEGPSNPPGKSNRRSKAPQKKKRFNK